MFRHNFFFFFFFFFCRFEVVVAKKIRQQTCCLLFYLTVHRFLDRVQSPTCTSYGKFLLEGLMAVLIPKSGVLWAVWRFYQIEFWFKFVQGWWSFGWPFFQTLKIERFPELTQIAMIIFVISHNQPQSSWCWERLFDNHKCHWCKHERAIHSEQTFS